MRGCGAFTTDLLGFNLGATVAEELDNGQCDPCTSPRVQVSLGRTDTEPHHFEVCSDVT